MNPLGFIWALAWANPYTDPPPGWPRTVAEIFIPSAHPGEGARRSVEISDAYHELITAGQTGYVITCTALIRRILAALERRLLHGLAFGEDMLWFHPED